VVKYTDGAERRFLSHTRSRQRLDGVSVFGNADRIILTAAFDNLGKGASGAAFSASIWLSEPIRHAGSFCKAATKILNRQVKK
jgi:hypothetical protein